MTATGKAAQIPDALLAKFATLSIGSPALPLAYPDIAFNPKTDAPDGKYAEASFFPNRAAWEGVASGVMDQGLFQVMVHWPRGAGIIGPNDAVQSVMDHFAKGTVLISGTTKVTIHREPWASAPLIEPHEQCIPVTIPYLASYVAPAVTPGGFDIEAYRSPDNDLPILVADFKNGAYWFNGSEVAVTDLFEQDANWGTWNTSAIVAGEGLSNDGGDLCYPVIQAMPLALILPHFTAVLTARFAMGINQSVSVSVLKLPDFTSESYLQLQMSSPGVVYARGATNDVGTGGATKIAGTFYAGGTIGSQDGSVVTDVSDGPASDTPNAVGLYLGGTGAGTASNFIESLVIYAPQPDADLPALSV